MTHSEHTQNADPAVRQRAEMRQVKLPAGVEPLHLATGKINGQDVVILFTDDGLYSFRDGVVHKCVETPARRNCRTSDRNYRTLWYAIVVVAVGWALWWTW